MIQHLAERCARARSVDEIAIATSTHASDDALEDFARTVGIRCFRGSLPNVMERIAAGTQALGWDAVVEILGDNPLVHADLIDEVVGLYRRDGLDYAATITREYGDMAPQLRRFALGIRVQVYSQMAALAWKEYPDFLQKDLGTSAYIFHHPERFRCGFVAATGRFEGLHRPEDNFAVNYQKNFELMERLFAELYPQNPDFNLTDVARLMDSQPAWRDLMGATKQSVV